MYNVLKVRKTWYNYVKKSIYWYRNRNATATQPNFTGYINLIMICTVLSPHTLSYFKNATVGFYLVSEKLINHITPFSKSFIHSIHKIQKDITTIFLGKMVQQRFLQTRFFTFIQWLISLLILFCLFFRVCDSFQGKRTLNGTNVFHIRSLQNYYCCLYEEDAMCVSM